MAKAAARRRRIHPVVIYPFRQPADLGDLRELYGLVARLNRQPETYARPLTVMDRKTWHANREGADFRRFRQNVARHSDILDAWCVDTCQMWYTGLGTAHELGGADDVYWLIPGDFNYGSAMGREVLGRLHDLPEIILELDQDVCIGEIATDHDSSKQLIDTYGTFALLYTWFPKEAAEIRQYTERPRSEFFALRHGFLGELLRRRWFAYEQTVVTLLHAVSGGRHISRFFVGQISDLSGGRESFAAAMQQVERTERVLRTIWRERHQEDPGWAGRYATLEAQSEQVRRAALTVLQNLLA
ncbi:MAG: hypothetical protein ACKVYV_14620 [Limisphaerales bacterium]